MEKDHNSQSEIQKSFLIWGGVLVVLVVMLWLILAKTDVNNPADLSTETTQIEEVDPEIVSILKRRPQDHVLGSENPKVTLVEYLDLQCPACAASESFVKQAVAEYGFDLQVIVRYFPLDSIHPQARLAIAAAESAHLQGQYWPMVAKIFDGQSQWSRALDPEKVFQQYAQDLDLDLDLFNQSFRVEQFEDLIKVHLSEANKLKLRGTPSFFLNNRQVQGWRNYADLSKDIKAEIEKSSASGSLNQKSLNDSNSKSLGETSVENVESGLADQGLDAEQPVVEEVKEEPQS